MKEYITITNNAAVHLADIPVLTYERFFGLNTRLLRNEAHHCVQYIGFPHQQNVKLICCIANDADATILISSAEISAGTERSYPSFSARHLSFHIFERILHENLGLSFSDHPWLKPVRYPFDRTHQGQLLKDYPFYQIQSEELHEVGVGPIHAGIIEPGHFRFICNGEQILHLEIQLGYQHRGVEKLFLSKKQLLQRALLAESIAGDSVAGHTTAFCNLWETLCGYKPAAHVHFTRTVAMELERIAVHTGDLGAICTDVGYQLGSAVFGRLRTPLVNFFQEWCGNRLAKGLIRAAVEPYELTPELCARLEQILHDFEKDFDEMWHEFHRLPSVLARLEKTGVITREVALAIGTVGMTARASGLSRDIRATHPHGIYPQLSPISVKHHGDVYSRAQIRHDEVIQSRYYLQKILRKPPASTAAPNLGHPAADTFAISLTEGWRGEICHCAVTDQHGELAQYRIKDPSVHNWLALALATRNNEISDFPVCNKSFNLSYCGHDL